MQTKSNYLEMASYSKSLILFDTNIDIFVTVDCESENMEVESKFDVREKCLFFTYNTNKQIIAQIKTNGIYNIIYYDAIYDEIDYTYFNENEYKNNVISDFTNRNINLLNSI